MNNISCNNIDFSSDQTFLSVLYGFVFCIGLPTNCLALYGLYRLVKTDNALPVYVINLLLSDLLQISMLPLWIDYYSHGHVWRFGVTSCNLVGSVFYISLYVSIFFMCCIALERYLAIVHPFFFQSIRGLRFACLFSLAVWVLVTIPPSVALTLLFKENGSSHCLESYPSNASFITYRLITLVFSFFLPLAFLVFVHVKTQRTLSAVLLVPEEEKKRIKGLLSLVLLIFVVVFGPYHLIGSIKYIGLIGHQCMCDFEAKIFIYYQVGRGLLSLNSLLDPIMYIFLRKDVRNHMLHFFPCLQRVAGLMNCQTSRSSRQTESSSATYSVTQA
ncbi:GPR4 protein, partial [Polyodon spathula]|nr:GPR4 protein [Polyodon spathula]